MMMTQQSFTAMMILKIYLLTLEKSEKDILLLILLDYEMIKRLLLFGIDLFERYLVILK
jgi:hypothetical protein